MIFKYKIKEDIRIKDYLKKKKFPENVKSSLKNKNGQLLVNDMTVGNSFEMHKGDILQVVFPSSVDNSVVPVNLPFEIVYEDSYILVINKKNNLATIPTKEHALNSLANFVLSYYKRKHIISNIHFVSRLDYATSGLIMLAKNSYMAYLLKENIIAKKYLLRVDGHLDNKKGLIQTGIIKDENSHILRKIDNSFINSKTEYRVIRSYPEYDLVEAKLLTGKTHQLRLHFSSINHPILGDKLYGTNLSGEILYLHSYYIKFKHPITKKNIIIKKYPLWY